LDALQVEPAAQQVGPVHL